MKRTVIILLIIILVCSIILFVKVQESKKNLDTLSKINSNDTMPIDDFDNSFDENITNETQQQDNINVSPNNTTKSQNKQSWNDKEVQEALQARQKVLDKEKQKQLQQQKKQQQKQQQEQHQQSSTQQALPQQTLPQQTLPNIGIYNTNTVIESRIENAFNGFNQYAIFELSNGQVWIQTQYKYSYHYAYRPEATIYRANARYYIMVDGMNDTVEVQQVTSYRKSRIKKAVSSSGYSTTSASINNTYFLNDGTVWRQTGLGLGLFLSNANVLIVKYGIDYYMQIDGVNGGLKVTSM